MQIDDLMIELIDRITKDMRKYKESIIGQNEMANLSMSEYYYLLAVNKLNDPTYGDLANELKVTKPSVTISVNKLIQKGYVYKIQNQKDKRVFQLQLTENGERLIQAEKKISSEFVRNAISCLNTEEQEQFKNILTKTLDAMKE